MKFSSGFEAFGYVPRFVLHSVLMSSNERSEYENIFDENRFAGSSSSKIPMIPEKERRAVNNTLTERSF